MLYYKKGFYAEARDFFETAKNNAEGTELADLAEAYIENIDQEGIKVKDWALSLTAGGQYDSNVIQRFVDQRSSGFHRFLNVNDVRQNFIFDINEF